MAELPQVHHEIVAAMPRVPGLMPGLPSAPRRWRRQLLALFADDMAQTGRTGCRAIAIGPCWRPLGRFFAGPVRSRTRCGPQRSMGRLPSMDADNVKWVTAALVVGLVAFATYGVVRQTQAIGEGRIVMAAGSQQHYELAESYRRDLERYGVKFEVQRGAEGFATLKAL